MANQKKSEEKKKRKISFSVNEKLLNKFDEFLEKEDISKRSKYIEKLIREDMERRGKDVSKDF
jgi:metal-responsive CopG/Arc/MetJ family transcriptional regulator